MQRRHLVRLPTQGKAGPGMRTVILCYASSDGTIITEIFTGERVTAQTWADGRGIVTVYDEALEAVRKFIVHGVISMDMMRD